MAEHDILTVRCEGMDLPLQIEEMTFFMKVHKKYYTQFMSFSCYRWHEKNVCPFHAIDGMKKADMLILP